MIQAIFFDRDGVLNEEVGYLWEIEKFKWMDGAREAIKFCNERGILAIVVTNQSGIARGMYTAHDVEMLQKFGGGRSAPRRLLLLPAPPELQRRM